MYRICTTEKAVAQQRKYEACLLELMYATPYAEVTIGDICSRMGTTRKSFYYYFDSKQDCLYALIDHAYYASYEFVLPDDMDLKRYPKPLLACLLYLKKERKLMDTLIRNDLFNLLVHRITTCVMAEAGYPRKNGKTVEHDHTLESLLYHINGVLAVVRLWHETGYQRSVYEMAEAICNLMPQDVMQRL